MSGETYLRSGYRQPTVHIVNDTHFANDNALTVTDPLGNVTVNTYDDLNRLLSTTTTPSVGDEIVVSYAYDQVGNRTRQTDGRDCIVRFTYDGLNRLLTTVHDAGTALVATETNAYNDLNKVSYEDAEGRVIEYAYDVRNRPTGETVPSRTQDNRTRTYDDVGNLLSVSHAGDTWRDTAQTYDALNRVLTETSSGLTHTHTYDKANNRLTTTYDKTGRVLTCTYDPGNRLLTQEDVLSGEPTRLTSFAYDPQGNLLVKTLTDSSTENRIFDVRNRVIELHVKEPDGTTTRLLQTYDYDLAGNLIALEESSPVGSLSTRVLTCAYDGTHRLIVEADQRGLAPAIVTNYTYDKADNRISREVFGGPDAGTTTYAIGNGGNGAGANQIASLTRPDTSVVAFTYDLTGARTSRTYDTRTDAYIYDVWSRLLTLDLQTPATPADRGLYEYSYDARTRRVSREELSVPTVLSFQGGVSIQEYAASPGASVGSLPSPTVEYVRGPDQGGGVGGILYSVRSGSASLAHSSARGDVVAKVDETTSTMTWQAQYEAFGRRPEETGANPDRQRANSKDEDPTGLLNEGFRYRDLETGTFITRDPAGFVDGPNLYTYVRQNPWTKWDPEGLFDKDKKTDLEELTKKLKAAAKNSAKVAPATGKLRGPRVSTNATGAQAAVATTQAPISLHIQAVTEGRAAGLDAANYALSKGYITTEQYKTIAVGIGHVSAPEMGMYQGGPDVMRRFVINEIKNSIVSAMTQNAVASQTPATTARQVSDDNNGGISVNRIGGGGAGNLLLKPAEEKLAPPGISVLLGVPPQAAAEQMRAAFPKATGLQESSKITGVSTIDRINKSGFMVMPDPAARFQNHGRIFHPAGVAGFSAQNLQRLSAAFVDVPTPPATGN